MIFMFKKMMAFVCVIALLVTQNSVSVWAINETETKTEIELDSLFPEKAYPTMVYNGTQEGKASFNYNLPNVNNGDNVTLSAIAEYSGTDVGEYYNVVLREFTLEGEDREKYELVDPCGDNNTITVNKGCISPKTVIYTPSDESEHYTGENYPKDLGNIKDIGYTLDDVVEGDTIEFTDNIKLNIVLVDGVYSYEIFNADGENVTNAIPTNNANYTVKLNEEDTPTVIQDGVPTIKSAIVKMATKNNKNQLIYYDDIGIVANNSVTVSVTAITDFKENINFTLVDSEGNQLAKPVVVKRDNAKTITDTSDNSLTYEYTADFTIYLSDENPSRTIESMICTINNGLESTTELALQLENSENTTKKLILDNDAPNITSPIAVSYNNNDKIVTVTGGFEDIGSGIKSIEYKWGSQEDEYTLFPISNFTTGVDLDVTTSYSELLNCEREDDKYELYLKVTDIAGNTFDNENVEDKFYCSEDGADQEPPKITDIKLSAVADDNTEVGLIEALKCGNSGNYSNKTLKLKITATDVRGIKNVSGGIESVTLFDYQNSGTSFSPVVSGDTYTFTLSNDCRIEDLRVKLVDKYGYLSIVSIKDELNNHQGTSGIESMLISDTWIIDKTIPVITCDYGSQVVIKENEDKYYNLENIDDAIFKIIVTEANGLSTYNVKRTYKPEGTDEEVASDENVVVSSVDGKFIYDVPIWGLGTGLYTYSVTATDIAGNSAVAQTYTFYVDKAKPTGKIQVTNSDEKVVDSKNWISEKDQDENNRKIVFRLYPVTTGSEIEAVKFVINGDNQNSVDVQLNESKIIENGNNPFKALSNKLNIEQDTNREYIDLELDTSKLSPQQKEACSNIFNISATVTTASGNTSDAIPYELHIDTEKPEITDFTVEKYENASTQILDILTFGIFSNKSIKLTVTVNDGANDAGIDYVKINHKYLEKAQIVELSPAGDSQYTVDLKIPEGESIFSSNIVITAYDRLGKSTTEFPDKSNTEETGNIVNSYFVMIEEDPPIAMFDLPTIDSAERTDGQTWYNNSNDNIIELMVKDISNVSNTGDVSDTNSGIRKVEVTVSAGENTEEVILSDDIVNKIHKIVYSFSINEIADRLKVYNNEKYTIKCKVVDNAGNVGYADEKTFYRDITNPTIQKFSFKPATANGYDSTNEFVDELEYGYYFQDEAKLVVTVDDTKDENGENVISSGFEKVVFRLVSAEDNVDEEKIEAVVVNNTAKCIIPEGFKGRIYTQAFDMIGNYSDEKTSKAFVVDGPESKPVITVEPLPDNKSKTDDEGNKLYTDTVKFKVTITDTKSGLKSVSYAKNSYMDSYDDVATEIGDATKRKLNEDIGNGWKVTKTDNNLVTEVSQTFVFDKDDKNICMVFNANDNSTNDAKETESEKFTIDTVSPIVKKFSFEPVTEDNISEVEKFIEELEYGFYFKKEFNVVVSVDDAVPSSGLSKVYFRLVSYDNGEIVSEDVQGISVENEKAVCRIPAGFKGQIYAEVYDRAINKSGEKTPQGFVVDEVPPTITIEPLPDNASKVDMAGNKLYTGTVQFRVTISDEKAGLRELVYSKSSEKDSFENVVTEISNTSGYKENDIIDNGWQVTKTDNNLITEVSQVFTFSEDDNDIVMGFIATDRSQNTCETEESERFTIDTISPKVTITNTDNPINDMYYKNSTKYEITVTERNFDASRMIADITNVFTDAKPILDFFTAENDVYVATLVFYEGDYEFSFSGTDCAGHRADVSTNKTTEISNYFYTMFNVDATSPVVSTNFGDFGEKDDKQIYFNTAQIAVIEVVEHNFYESDMNIIVKSKASGTAHTADNEGWYNIGYASTWKHNDDKHTLQIKFEQDGIYTISLSPTDRAQNTSPGISSAIYEIDTTTPQLYKRNDQYATDKDFVTTPYREVYDEEKKNSPAPTVEFEDLNFDRIEIEAVIYRPEYENGKEFGEVKVDSLSEELSGSVKNKKFTLSDFKKDGVYSLTYVAVDKAGNKSEPINDTYFRMIKTDVLAYINNSSIKDKTGYYSLMDEDGTAISKKASDFKDLSISVIKLKGDKDVGVLTLRDDEQEYSPEGYTTVEDTKISETAIITETQLPASYFTETFRDDSLDTRMYLSVSIDKNSYLDLASIHIDNEPPTATKPEGFVNWHNYLFTKEVTISLTSISETLNADACKVYEYPRDVERTEIPFEYDKEKKTLTFTLSEGLHNVDITLVDEAGNESNLDRVKNLRVGNFRLYLCVGIGVMLIGIIISIILWRKRKQN